MPRTTKPQRFDAREWKRNPGMCTQALAGQFLNISMMLEGLAELAFSAERRDRKRRINRQARRARGAR